jgi:hypothetical protein
MPNLERYCDIFKKCPPLRQGSSHFAAKGGFWFTQPKLGPHGILDGFLGFVETIFDYGFNFNEG